ncbi:MAG: protein-L-isoaspartate(D-aspartate) O-methyltransferase [Chloroflexi bacterium]|nr:protein-L-isoaspartate(D-aspartate) O-methyltransferase [Chloroflexota bacterium]
MALTHDGTDDYAVARARLIASLKQQIRDDRVIKAMSRVPRELFVPPEARLLAYDDRPLPIGWGQTISQPFMIALMTSALRLTGSEKVLEIGTGSGYQTAILAEIARKVVSVERLSELAERARLVLDRLGYTNAEVHLSGATLGWPQGGPYQAILIAAGAPRVPDSLLEQLELHGRMVLPVGSRHDQELIRVTKLPATVVTERLGGCRFVPLIGPEAWDED